MTFWRVKLRENGILDLGLELCALGFELWLWALGFGLWAWVLGIESWSWAALPRPVRKASGFPFAPLEAERLRLERLSRQKSYRLAGKPEAFHTGRGKAA